MLWKMTFVKFLKNFWETSTTAFIFINLQGIISSAIRQKWESLNGCFKKTKHAQFPEKRIFRTCAYQGGRNVRFSENLACFVFLKHSFWDSPVCLITDDTQLFHRLVIPLTFLWVFGEIFEKSWGAERLWAFSPITYCYLTQSTRLVDILLISLVYLICSQKTWKTLERVSHSSKWYCY